MLYKQLVRTQFIIFLRCLLLVLHQLNIGIGRYWPIGVWDKLSYGLYSMCVKVDSLRTCVRGSVCNGASMGPPLSVPEHTHTHTRPHTHTHTHTTHTHTQLH
uniref:Uncharacterized protein n=1 Tax=Labrus bergylta TaxID=56723 RepID=A0A3Q3MSU4_9LABR